MKQALTFIFCILLLTCSKEDSNNASENVDTLDGGTIYTAQIVEVNIDYAASETYQGLLGDAIVELKRTTTNSLVFFVEPDFVVGNTTLIIQGLNNLTVNYTVEQTQLTQTVEQTIQPYFEQIAIERQGLTPENNGDKAIQLIDGFTNLYSSLNDEQKEDISIFYKANQNLFDAAITGDANRFNSDVATQFTSCQASIYFTGILGVFSAVSTTLPFTQIATPILSAATGLLLYKTYQNCGSLSSETIKNVFVQAEDQIYDTDSFDRSASNETAISFSTDVARDVAIQIQNRTMLPGDSEDSNSLISTYFSATADFNTLVVQKMNTAINYLNTEWSMFFDIEPYDNIEVNDTPTTATNSISEEDFDNFTFSISNSNLNLESLSFSNGGINLKIKIIDEDAITNGSQTGTLDFTYQDDFNSFSGSYDIEVYTDSILGAWLLLYDCDAEGCDDYAITFNADGTISSEVLNDPEITVIENQYTYANNNISVTIITDELIELNCNGDDFSVTVRSTASLSLSRISENEFSGTDSFNTEGYSDPSGDCSYPAEGGTSAVILSR